MPSNRSFAAVLKNSRTLLCCKSPIMSTEDYDEIPLQNFEELDLPVEFSSIALGYDNLFVGIAEEDGSLWSWGDNSQGQLGTEDRTFRHIPAQLPNTKDFVKVSCGHLFTYKHV